MGARGERVEPRARCVQDALYSANDVGVSQTVTRSTGKPCSMALSKISLAMRSTVGLLSMRYTGSPSACSGATSGSSWRSSILIELGVDPAFDDPLDVAEIAHHVAVVERPGADFDFRGGVVAVRMFADAVVVEQPVAVAEID